MADSSQVYGSQALKYLWQNEKSIYSVGRNMLGNSRLPPYLSSDYSSSCPAASEAQPILRTGRGNPFGRKTLEPSGQVLEPTSKGINTKLVEWINANHSRRWVVVHPDPQSLMDCSRGAIANHWQQWQADGKIRTVEKRIEESGWNEVKAAITA